MRIHITGNSGSGKTTFARQLGQALNLQVYGLDKIVWQPGWVKTPSDQRAVLENKLIARDQWIIEGVSARVRRAADIIVFLDVPRPIAYVRALKRNLPYLFKNRPDLPEDCPEWKFMAQHMSIVWRFGSKTRTQILDDMRDHPCQGHLVRTNAQRNLVLNQLTARPW